MDHARSPTDRPTDGRRSGRRRAAPNRSNLRSTAKTLARPRLLQIPRLRVSHGNVPLCGVDDDIKRGFRTPTCLRSSAFQCRCRCCCCCQYGDLHNARIPKDANSKKHRSIRSDWRSSVRSQRQLHIKRTRPPTAVARLRRLTHARQPRLDDVDGSLAAKSPVRL
jgi:hypothetical protein